MNVEKYGSLPSCEFDTSEQLILQPFAKFFHYNGAFLIFDYVGQLIIKEKGKHIAKPIRYSY